MNDDNAFVVTSSPIIPNIFATSGSSVFNVHRLIGKTLLFWETTWMEKYQLLHLDMWFKNKCAILY